MLAFRTGDFLSGGGPVKSSENTPLLSVKKLGVYRGRDWVIENLSLSLERGRITGLSGPNGAGKTTFFEVLAGLLKPQVGEIEWSPDGASIAYLAQSIRPKRLLPSSVKDFIRMGTWSSAKAEAALSINEALEVMDLKSIENEMIHKLSGGQWKRVLIARCLVQKADLYLLDEPFNHLDLQMEQRLTEVFQTLVKTKAKTFFLISHDWHAMDHLCDHLFLINRTILAQGSVREVSEKWMDWKDPKHHRWMHN